MPQLQSLIPWSGALNLALFLTKTLKHKRKPNANSHVGLGR